MSVIIFPFCSFEDVAYGMNDTDGLIDINSAYGCEMYVNELARISSKTTSYKDTILSLCST